MISLFGKTRPAGVTRLPFRAPSFLVCLAVSPLQACLLFPPSCFPLPYSQIISFSFPYQPLLLTVPHAILLCILVFISSFSGRQGDIAKPGCLFKTNKQAPYQYLRLRQTPSPNPISSLRRVVLVLLLAVYQCLNLRLHHNPASTSLLRQLAIFLLHHSLGSKYHLPPQD